MEPPSLIGETRHECQQSVLNAKSGVLRHINGKPWWHIQS